MRLHFVINFFVNLKEILKHVLSPEELFPEISFKDTRNRNTFRFFFVGLVDQDIRSTLKPGQHQVSPAFLCPHSIEYVIFAINFKMLSKYQNSISYQLKISHQLSGMQGSLVRSEMCSWPVANKKFFCTFPGCGKEFNRSGTLKRHFRMHTGEIFN